MQQAEGGINKIKKRNEARDHFYFSWFFFLSTSPLPLHSVVAAIFSSRSIFSNYCQNRNVSFFCSPELWRSYFNPHRREVRKEKKKTKKSFSLFHKNRLRSSFFVSSFPPTRICYSITLDFMESTIYCTPYNGAAGLLTKSFLFECNRVCTYHTFVFYNTSTYNTNLYVRIFAHSHRTHDIRCTRIMVRILYYKERAKKKPRTYILVH